MATTIKIVGEDWCPFTQGKADGESAEQGAWLQMPSGAQVGDSTKTAITYQKLDCGLDACADGQSQPDVCLSAADKTTYCDAAQGFPSFMDAAGNTCTRGFDRAKGFDGDDGITETIQEKLKEDSDNEGTFLCTA